MPNNIVALPVLPQEGTLLSSVPTGPIPEWMVAQEFADIAAISIRKARLAATKCLSGGTWRGVRLEVRHEGRALMIHALSLPQDLRDIWHERYQVARIAEAAEKIKLSSSSAHDEKIAMRYTWQRWRLEIIAPALKFQKYTSKRSAAITRIMAQTIVKPTGKPWKPKIATIEHWIKLFEEGGAVALIPKEREEGVERVLVSRAWDQACPLDAEQKAALAERLATIVKSLWAETSSGWRRINDLAVPKFRDACQEAGWKDVTPDQCKPGRPFIERFRDFSLVAIQVKNNRQFFDQYLPRIQRQRNTYKPGDIVVGDVHPMDVVREIDGREVYARLISWLDLATYDIFVTPVILPKGQGIRQEHIAASFVSMVEAWGLPRQLRLDNGKEYKWEAMIDGFYTLAGLIRAYDIFHVRLLTDGEIGDFLDVEQFAAVSRARPYNAPAKQIEHVFSIIEYNFFEMMNGWVGGDRMNKRTQLVGQDPKAHRGADEEFTKDLEICLDLYRNTKQKDGSSPNEKRRHAIENGWKAIGISRESMVFAFSECKKLTVGQGRVQYRGRWYAADVLIPLAQRSLEFHVAKWAPEAIFHVDRHKKIHAIPLDKVFNQHDGEGAKEQSRRAGVLNRHIRELKKQIEPVKLLEEAARYNALLPPKPEIPFGPVITTEGGEAVAKALADMTEPKTVKLQPGQFLHPTLGHVIEMRPANEEGPKPTDIDFDPLNFALPPPETQKPNPEELEFDLNYALTVPSDGNGKDKP